MSVFWPAFVAGIVVIIVGVLSIVLHDPLLRLTSEIQRTTLGRVGNRVSNKTPKGSMIAAGVGFIAFGILAVVMSFFFLRLTRFCSLLPDSSERVFALGGAELLEEEPMSVRQNRKTRLPASSK